MSQKGYLEGFCLETTSVKLETKKLSGSFFTPPMGKVVRFRHRGQVKSLEGKAQCFNSNSD